MMRLRALRVSEVGQFTKPITMEGIGDGLNVLTGPNELGKSTLLKALDALLRVKYNSNAEQIRDLQPNSGGAPLIEAEFEADGHLWRLRKQFLNGRLASLLDVTSGALLRNADAETHLAALMSGTHAFDRFGLLWVRQGVFEPARDSDGHIASLLASEVDAVALDARARAIHARVRDEISALQTEKTRKPRGTLLASLKSHDGALTRLAKAEALARTQAERLAELARLTNEREALMAPQAIAAREEALAAAQKRYETAEAARHHRSEAAKQLHSARDALQIADREHQSILEDLASLDRLTRENAAARDASVALHTRYNGAKSALKAAEATIHQQQDLLARLEKDVETATAAARARQAVIDRDKLAAQIATVRTSAADAARARDTIAALKFATPERLQALQLSIQQLGKIEASLASVVPEVSIALEAGAEHQVVVGGQSLSGNAVFNPDTPLTIDIAGIGRITISPNPATLSSQQRAIREATRAEVEAAFAFLGVSTLADAQSLLAEKQRAESMAREADIKIQALAPHGLEALLATHAELSAQAALVATHINPTSVTAALGSLEEQKIIARRYAADLEASKHAANTLAIEHAKSETNAAALMEQLAQLERKIGDAAARERTAALAKQKLDTARTAFTEAKLAADAWDLNADTDNIESLVAKLAAARTAISQADDHRIAIDRQMSGLEGELRAASEDDIESELENARAMVVGTASRLAEVQAELSALELLDREFKSMADAGRRELSGPILGRVLPNLAKLFPDAALELDESLAPSRLHRSGRIESHAQLSDGTREQVAILVRLGLADFLADKGAAVPVILDDALVYSDDQRIATMFKILQQAARRHQVIVLNCHEQTFSPLAHAQGATVLTLKPWVQSAIAA